MNVNVVTTVELISAWYAVNQPGKSIAEAREEVSRHNQKLIREARYSTLVDAADIAEGISAAVATALRNAAEQYKEIAE